MTTRIKNFRLYKEDSSGTSSIWDGCPLPQGIPSQCARSDQVRSVDQVMSVRVWPGWVRSNGVRSGQLGSGQVRRTHWTDWAVVGSHHHQRLVDVRVDKVQTGVVNPTAKQRAGGAIHTQSVTTHARNTEHSEETWEASQGVNERDKWYSHPHLVQVLKCRRRYGQNTHSLKSWD